MKGKGSEWKERVADDPVLLLWRHFSSLARKPPTQMDEVKKFQEKVM
jgi:hypothetical protein